MVALIISRQTDTILDLLTLTLAGYNIVTCMLGARIIALTAYELTSTIHHAFSHAVVCNWLYMARISIAV